jgi:hypothetical protein
MDKIDGLKTRTYTKAELIQELEQFDDDTPVMFMYNYGDHWRTNVAEGIKSVEESNVVWSDYHRMYKEEPERDYHDDDEDEPTNPTTQAVIIIR